MSLILDRRTLVLGAAATLAGCDRLAKNETVREALFSAGNFHKWAQRSLMARDALAREFRPDQISPFFRPNGTANPNTAEYKALWRNGFADWRLHVTGLVGRPLSLSLAQLHALPHREQITRHDCVEGWSAIGKWRGVPLKPILDAARLRDGARYIVFHCADDMGGGRGYYESIDLEDAFHPQTILAFALNDEPLRVANGAPLRLRVERQLGYKQAKYLMKIEAVASLDGIGGGKGGYWEDRAGYDWYAGI
ncbi:MULTISPECIES: molybdopterin-dependent oxidoreductase [Sphingobium]|uniref:Molybdopterin oxidoreductase n=1 Tax=Sphingobium fuliginis (strain ATCC 27551) TaxID=336203 RepID=A0ABQ1ELT3_SPHSA|nr:MULTISPECIES: molybdopterin-dependent oxidoreductase [Sphingobium]AJR22847.1 molybdopterin-binding protein [Sphingobium sp. YBL2]RYM01210.1 molybdopterin-binding protein [Sphingobium fuliginis]WDA38784.1 molybdopterin-dependent oxidoreductase [Sphingobium sp. YC-XJ3]GFZ77058.1 molybdopterin oxidoreductase [Sphingobium fuliginis]